MARPTKQTVDYFPHTVTHGKTMYIVESMFGNDGYAFWFKLLELLGSSPGHFYDCHGPSAWMFLIAKTRVSEDTAHRILQTLAGLNAIDEKLWEKKVIWCQHFVDGVKDAYSRRMDQLPTRQRLCVQVFGSCAQEPEAGEASDDGNTRKERKEEERKVKKNSLSTVSSAGVQCPPEEIIDLYHKILPALPKIKQWTEKRQKALRARWRETPERQSLDWRREFFVKIGASDFLMGRKTDFRADLEWLITAGNFTKVLEGRYDNDGGDNTRRSPGKTSAKAQNAGGHGDGQPYPVDFEADAL